jgi:plastocyanin
MINETKITRRFAVGLLAIAATGPIAITKARAAGVAVKISDFVFSPPALTVKAGTTVTWTNEDDAPHTVDATIGTFKSGVLDSNERFSFTFTAPGSYKYFCALHPHMIGTVTVEAVTGSTALP